MSRFEATPSDAQPVATLDVSARAEFVKKTYSHVLGSILFFTLVELVFFATPVADAIVESLAGSRATWLLYLGGFMVVGWLASNTAVRAKSPGAQYAALFGYVLVEAVIFVPLLWIADRYAPGAIQSAALVTVVGFSGLTAIAFVLKKDFSFLRGIVMWGGVVALLLIVGSIAFGFQLGTFFSVAMIGLAGASVLYQTSNILLHYPEDRYVGAALALFASIALMFWYVLRIFLAARD